MLLDTPEAVSLLTNIEELLEAKRMAKQAKIFVERIAHPNKDNFVLLRYTGKGINTLAYNQPEFINSIIEALQLEFIDSNKISNMLVEKTNSITINKLKSILPTRKNIVNNLLKSL